VGLQCSIGYRTQLVDAHDNWYERCGVLGTPGQAVWIER
jgi:hypothetical protein